MAYYALEYFWVAVVVLISAGRVQKELAGSLTSLPSKAEWSFGPMLVRHGGVADGVRTRIRCGVESLR